eukprot:5149426-Lingulodinium_polyedra.AAC.1
MRDEAEAQAAAGLPEKLLPLQERQAPEEPALRLQAAAKDLEQAVGPATRWAAGHNASIEGPVLGWLQPGPGRVD